MNLIDNLIIIFAFFIYLCLLSLFLDYLHNRNIRRQFYRDLVQIVLLYENSDLYEISIQVPKILGPRIIHFATYDALINDLSIAYEADLTNCHSLLEYVLSLHKSYCFSDQDLIKFKNKLYKEKIKK